MTIPAPRDRLGLFSTRRRGDNCALCDYAGYCSSELLKITLSGMPLMDWFVMNNNRMLCREAFCFLPAGHDGPHVYSHKLDPAPKYFSSCRSWAKSSGWHK